VGGDVGLPGAIQDRLPEPVVGDFHTAINRKPFSLPRQFDSAQRGLTAVIAFGFLQEHGGDILRDRG
jgi:hypothetical protein